LPPRAGRPRSMPLPVRLLQVSTLVRTNLITRALAAVFDTSQSTTDRIIHHLIPVLADAPRPTPHDTAHPWIIDTTLIPVHDQSITAIQQELPPQRQLPDQHLRSSVTCDRRRPVLAR
ncbi:MAG: hypothetical protein JWR34_5192, partial [Mycobacterium sp.]|nr:hypothetical protein [Mycobacterium sp.]